MPVRQDIINARNTAMKQKDTAALNVLRILYSAIKNAEIDAGHELNDEETGLIIKRQVKQLREAVNDFTKGNRPDLVEKTKSEIDVISPFLPEEMSDEQLQQIVQSVVKSMPSETNIGKVMGAVMQQVKGKADGSRVRDCVEKTISV
ncbi:MAG: aspartyl-tRNA amidotransferase [Candidatus Magasanikbacteria bacterium]|nr:aspartyl-tRNA amidotransferase [Candidatus Magasanikbacteria bacterium]|tara:strand:- start:1309 stop:1749 length:441 start_codon:yes stop_codon:yes gene_type:complete